MINKLGQLILGFAVSVLLGRYLGPDKFGIYSLAVSVFSILTIFVNFGLDEPFIKNIVGKFENALDELWKVFNIKFLVSISIVLLFLLLSCFSNTKIIHYINYIIWGLIFVPFLTINSLYEARVESKKLVIPLLVQLIMSASLKMIGIYLKLPLEFFIAMFAFDFFLQALLLIIISKIEYKDLKYKFSIAFKRYFKSSWPLFFSSVAAIIYMRLDQLLLKYLMGDFEVGIYSAALKFSEAWYFIPVVIVSSFFPSLLSSEKNLIDLNKKTQTILDLLMLLAFSVSLITILSSSLILQVTFGQRYLESSHILNIHIFTGIFVCLGVASGKWMITLNLQKHTFYRSIVGLLINIILNFLLISKYGVAGAAYATLLSQIFATFLYDLFVSELRPIFICKIKSLFFIFRLKEIGLFVRSKL